MKNNFIKLIIFSTIVSLIGCKKDFNERPNQFTEKKAVQGKKALYNQFATILSKAVNDNSNLRNFLKRTALEKINNDYDIFYNFIKDEVIDADKSVKEILMKYEEYPNQLNIIESESPLLTIFIPNIDSKIFNAEIWDSEKQIPVVTTNLMKDDSTIPVYENGKEIFSLKSNEIPGFPIIVVKTNERIILKDNNLKSSNNTNSVRTKNSFAFISEVFDNSLTTSSKTSKDGFELDPIVINAGQIFGNDNNKYWQRDHIYYGLTPSKTEGSLNLQFEESIVSLTLSEEAMKKISDQNGDPKFVPKNTQKEITISGDDWKSKMDGIVQKNAWTDGDFEIRFDVLINNTRGIGSVYSYYLPLKPTSLFSIGYTSREVTVNNSHKIFVTYTHLWRSVGGNKSLEYKTHIPIINWDLKSNSPLWKITVSEVDAQENITTQEEVTNQFATNFGFDTKIGLKFGASNTETVKNSISITKQVGDDNLGSVLVEFSDPVVIVDTLRDGTRRPGRGGRGNTVNEPGKIIGYDYTLKEYGNHYFKLKILPTRKK